ncbi:unnamed protein product, partial [Didymodactylos carnosus]
HFLGDKQYAKQAAHGNTKKTTTAAHVYRRTRPSTITKIRQGVRTDPGTAVYKSMVGSGDVLFPRNVRQANYQRTQYLRKQRLSKDELLNTILLSISEINDYIRSCSLPELTVVLMHEHAEESFEYLLNTTTETIPLYYDTTFQVRQFYLSVSLDIF